MNPGGWKGRLERAFKRHGPLGSMLVVARFMIVQLRAFIDRNRSGTLQRDAFDARHGVDTGGRISLSDLSALGETAVWGNRYQGVSQGVFDALMAACGVDHARFVFVDLGSGKGRALLFASHYPFRRIVGVELTPELHAIAQDNVAKYHDDGQRCFTFELHCGDVNVFTLPSEPCLVYMYNPFEGPVMQRTAAAIGALAEDPAREIIVAYVDARMARAFNAQATLQRVAVGNDYVVWHSRGVVPHSS